MLLLAESLPIESAPAPLQIQLPAGLIGLPQLTCFEVSSVEGSWPFVNLRALGAEEMHFIAIEPQDVIADYDIELNDMDCAALGLDRAEDAIVYNIATVHSLDPQHVTVNLIGPVIVNRHTSLARQVILLNSERYSPRHVLIDERETAAQS